MKTLPHIAVFGLLLTAQTTAQAPAQPIVEWNEQVLAVAKAEDGFLTLKGLRTATIMHIAIHDALARIGAAIADTSRSPRSEHRRSRQAVKPRCRQPSPRQPMWWRLGSIQTRPILSTPSGGDSSVG